MSNINLSNDNINKLLNIAGKKLGQDPNKLKQQLQQGKLDNVIKNLDPKSASQINSLLKNPKALEAMLNNEQTLKVLQGLMGKK